MNNWTYWIERQVTCKTLVCELIHQNIGTHAKIAFRISLEKVILSAKLSFVAAMLDLSKWPQPIADICHPQKIGHPHKYISRHQDHVSMPFTSNLHQKLSFVAAMLAFQDGYQPFLIYVSTSRLGNLINIG